MYVTTLPVYSALAPDQDIPEAIRNRLPTGWHLSTHQVETYQALCSDADVIFNTAMTGDGKSLAGQLPMLVHQRTTMAMYPTNELIGDQLRQVDNTLPHWQQEAIRRVRLDARALDTVEAEVDVRRADALLNLYRNHELVLTNPDIFHYVMQQYYLRTGKHGDAPDYVVGRLLNLFEQFTFDEFHIFQAPQVVAVLNALLFIHEVTGTARPKKFLFLSATPGVLMLQYLERANLRVTQVQGRYLHTRQMPDAVHWRRILHGTTLHCAPLRAEEWVETHLDDTLLPFFLDHRPAAKGAIIVNSVASAQRLLMRLRPVFKAHGLTVEPNTGFDAASRRQASYDADLLIGTSTVDVGVDFQINFLVFESHNAGSFLQRFGRLGRHDKFIREGTCYPFGDTFTAYALLPPWVYERLFQAEAGMAPPLADGMEVDREQLHQIIHDAFPPQATFERYGRAWGGLQAAAILKGLYHPTIKGQYSGTRERLAERYKQVLGVSMKRELGRLIELQRTHKALLEEARSFRGGGEFRCGVLDMQETGAAQVKTYEMFGLLANFELAPLDKEEFVQAAEQWQISRRIYDADNITAYFRVLGVRSARQEVRVLFKEDIESWGPQDFGIAQVLQHIEVDAEHIPERTRLNRGLRQRHVVVLLCLLHPVELARRLRLPWPFPLYHCTSRDGLTGSIAFGRQALLLEVALQARPDIACGGDAIPMIV